MKPARSVILLVPLLAASCTAFRPEDRPPAEAAGMPAAYTGPAGEAALSNRWWEAFGSAELNGLVETALARNFSIAQADARLRQARALARQAGAALWPAVTAEAGARTVERETEGVGQTARDTYDIGLAASYELDLWGRVRSSRRAAALDAAAAELDLATAAMTLSAEVVLRYLELLEARQTRAVLEEQAATNRKTLELIELRFKRGRATALDVLQQREILVRSESLLPLQRGREQTLLSALAVLQGRAPGENPNLAGAALPAMPAFPETGLPADLLARRPDLRAAWTRLRAAEWSGAAARADRLPAFRITAGAGYENETVSTLFDNWILNLAGNLSAPLADGGRRRAEVARRAAVVDERLAAYRATALAALRDVHDAVALETVQAEALAAARKQLALAVAARERAFDRYGKGQESYLRVLSAITNEQSLRRALVEAERLHLAYRVQLYRALGGDWITVLHTTRAHRENNGTPP